MPRPPVPLFFTPSCHLFSMLFSIQTRSITAIPTLSLPIQYYCSSSLECLVFCHGVIIWHLASFLLDGVITSPLLFLASLRYHVAFFMLHSFNRVLCLSKMKKIITQEDCLHGTKCSTHVQIKVFSVDLSITSPTVTCSTKGTVRTRP